MQFSVETDTIGLKRIVVRFDFHQERSIRIHGHDFDFQRAESIRLFFSYRHTPVTIEELLRQHGIIIVEQWQNGSGEEGVFLCRRT
jgi:uncharacterized SAM-dependent methyltransferase